MAPKDISAIRRLRCAHLIDSLRADNGGPSRSVPGLVEALLHSSVDVGLFHMRDCEDFAAEGRTLYKTGVVRFGLPAIPARDESASVLHVHGIWSPRLSWTQGAWRARGAGPIVISPRGSLDPWSLRQNQGRKRLAWDLWQRKCLEGADVLHATAWSEAAQFRRLGLTTPIAVVPNGAWAPDAARNGPREKRFVVLARIHPKKGIDLLLEALAANRDELLRGGWTCLIAGPDDGGHKEPLVRRAQELGLTRCVTWSDPVDGRGKWDLLAGSRFSVLPTRAENFGISILESLLTGTPVVTTHGAPWRSLAERRIGWWVPVSVEGITHGIREALQCGEDDLRVMGDCGRRWASSTFGWERIAEQMKAAYAWVLGQGPLPPWVHLCGSRRHAVRRWRMAETHG